MSSISLEVERLVNVNDGNTNMHGSRKSDVPIVPAKSTNKPATAAAELMEERGALKGSSLRVTRTRHSAGLSEF